MAEAHASLDDVGLLRRYAAQRDPAAFGELVRRYADFVYATARRMTGSAAAAEDVSQDCFLRLAQRSATITGSVAAWLHRTSVNRSLEILRSDAARRKREAAVAQTHTDDVAAELIAQVDEALAAMDEELRIPLTEHFLCGRSQADLAAAIGVNQSTVSRRIEKGIAELRQRLRAQGVTAAAVGTLPMLLQPANQALAPSALRSAISKIGLSGVNAPAAAGAIQPAMMALWGTIGAIGLIGGTALWFHRHSGPSSAPRGAGAANPPAAATTQKNAERFELDDLIEDHGDDKADDNDDDDKKP